MSAEQIDGWDVTEVQTRICGFEVEVRRHEYRLNGSWQYAWQWRVAHRNEAIKMFDGDTAKTMREAMQRANECAREMANQIRNEVAGMKETIVNAVITRATVRMSGYQGDMLSLDVYVNLQGGGGGQIEGHHVLYLPPSWSKHTPESLLGHIIYHWFEATGARSVEDMAGKPIRVKFPHDGGAATPMSPCHIGHIVKEDKWFSTDEICKQMYKPQGGQE